MKSQIMGVPDPSFSRSSIGFMALFLSTTTNKLDAKGRVSVPAAFRDALAAEATKAVVVLKSPKLPCLDGFAPSFMETMAQRLDSFDLFSDDQDDLAMSIFGQAQILQFDPEGRIPLPADLKAHASLNGEVAFVGLGRKFQIWNPKELAKRQNDALKTFKSKKLTLPGEKA
jgi:MraZ protein